MFIIIDKNNMIVSACDYKPDQASLDEHEYITMEISDNEYSVDMIGAIYNGN